MQKFYGLVTGNEWTRKRRMQDTTYTRDKWYKTALINDSCYSVFVLDNDKVYKNTWNQDNKMPYMVYQDPTANVIMKYDSTDIKEGSFEVRHTGVYDISCISQFNIDIKNHATPSGIQVSVMRKDGDKTSSVGQITHSATDIYDEASKVFHPVKCVVGNVLLTAGHEYFVTIGLTRTTSQEKDEISFDPYKNLLAIDPIHSRSRTGHRIINTLYKTMGGLSFSGGNEVRVERSIDNKTVRVFGQTYSTDFKDLNTSTEAE